MKTISRLNHPCLLKYIGYSPVNFKNKPKPTIITECTIKDNLYDILHRKNANSINDYYNDTLKLISIYGIASSLSYLHHNDIVHPDLCSSNVLFDSYLLPKISNYSNSLAPFYNDEQKEEKQARASTEKLKKIGENPRKCR